MDIAGEIFEIVSADSVQVYRHMDIGSCKPDKNELEKIKHHLIDIVDPDYQFTAGEFCERAANACSEISFKNRVPLFVGGTGLYISSYFGGISEIPEIPEKFRIILSEEAENLGLEALYHELEEIDPIFAKKIHCNDRQRIIRGLEVFRSTGKAFSSFHKNGKKDKNPDIFFAGIYFERDVLNRRIEIRVEQMINKGLVDEVLSLRNMGYSPELNSMKSIGYYEINDYIDRKISLDEAVEKIKVNTKRYAKKQMTWFKRMNDIIWFKNDEKKILKEKIKNWLNQ